VRGGCCGEVAEVGGTLNEVMKDREN
jgi:hypothetical protein